jgi:hypothetical protein
MAAGQPPGVADEFRRRRTKQLAVTAVVVPAIIGLLWLKEHPGFGIADLPEQATAILLLAVVFGVLIFSFGNWRCPKCNGYLGKAISPKFCARCGVQLQ